MQCNQPLYRAGFQNDNQFSQYYPQTHYPDVIGEGDVISFILPDGSVRCYFVPVNTRIWTPYYNNSYVPSCLPIWPNNNNEAWFVRSILNGYPAAGSNHVSNNYGDPFTKPYVNSQTFVQKFHNDSCTSTSDLHYFFPRLRHDWAKGCAAIQVEIPTEEKSIFHYGAICNRPCYCNHKIDLTKTEANCTKNNCTETPMCTDEIKSSLCCDDSKKKQYNRSKNKNYSCACPTQSRADMADKLVTTYADQAISCTDMKGSYSQTSKGRRVDKTDIETEVWHPRKRRCKDRCSCSALVWDSACCLGSACSETE